MKYFVWVSGQKQADAQIWHDDQMFANGKPVIFKRKLEPYEENLCLDELAKLYEDKKNVHLQMVER